MRDDLVGEYIGQTAPKTKRVLERAKGGVLFIDEAYYLYRGNDSKDYGQEAIEILLQVMENDRDQLVVILAGYKDRMEVFFESNPGMRSRLAHHLDFASYDIDELTAIGALMLDQTNYYLSPEAEAVLRAEVSRMMTEPHFANARTVRNELELARLQARAPHRLRRAPRVDPRRADAPRADRRAGRRPGLRPPVISRGTPPRAPRCAPDGSAIEAPSPGAPVSAGRPPPGRRRSPSPGARSRWWCSGCRRG